MKTFKIIFFASFFILNINELHTQTSIKFAAIGDYGTTTGHLLQVSDLIKSWNPDLIITLGDNNYPTGGQETIDQNIGQFFHMFIYPYFGSYGTGDTVNRFFPSLGNHDWMTAGALPYLNYFTLPGNERYYDFVKGPVHFFVIDSDFNEPDGTDNNSVQAQWLMSNLASSSSKFNVVYFHHTPYTSGNLHGPAFYMRWPFKEWGASLVMAAHVHVYERFLIDGLTYITNGLGGAAKYGFFEAQPGSQVRYADNYGAMLLNAYPDSLTLKFINVLGNVIDNYKILPSLKTLSLTAFIEGFYNPYTDIMIPDTLTVYLRNSIAPFSLVDSVKSMIDTSGEGLFNFKKADNAKDYFIVVKHRNSLETWSSGVNRFINNNLSYNFSGSSSGAFGNNLILKGGKYCVYSGDVNNNGFIDLDDIISVHNLSNLFPEGYNINDVNGNNVVDLNDVLIVYNNTSNFVSVLRP
jgi:hypothetical protein